MARRRVFGSRKYGGLSRLGPQNLAVAVIDHYLQWDPNTAKDKWVREIEKYQDDPQRVKQAQIALASWYMALDQVRNDIRRAFEKAKEIRSTITEEQVMAYLRPPATVTVKEKAPAPVTVTVQE